MRELIFISACPDDLYFSWQYEIFIENVRSLGYTNEIRILLYLPKDRESAGWNPVWESLEERYKDQGVKIFRYNDDHNILGIVQKIGYIPLLRPYVLKRHFDEHPDLKEKAIFYHDSDIVFTKYFDFSPYLDDDICYLSDTKSYINSDYFDSKDKDVKPEMIEAYKQIDVLDTCAKMLGIDRQICEKNKDVSGGAQYLLKNIDADFWADVYRGCIIIRNYLAYHMNGINRRFFSDENKGFQSWCADMWSVLWNLWKRDMTTATPPEFDFAWATDDIEKWSRVNIYHDAGGGPHEPTLFNKRSLPYVNNERTPFLDTFSVNPQKCSYLYTKEIEKVRDKYYT